MQRIFPLLALSAALAGASGPAGAETVRAGEWELLQNGGHRKLICQHSDLTFDRTILTRMSRAPGVKCVIESFTAAAPQISVHETCQSMAGAATVDLVMTFTSPEAYASRTKIHMVSGLRLPDLDIHQAARRLGDCQPGDVQSPY